MKRVYLKNTKKLFSDLNEEKASGLAFTAAIFSSLILTIVLLIVLNLFGATYEGYEKTDWWKYCSFLLSQCAFVVAIIMYFSGSKTSVREVIGKPKFRYFVVALALQFGLFSLSSLNDLFLRWLGRFGYTPTSVELPSVQGAKVLPVLFVVAVLPACLEELFFRGVLFRGLKKFGAVAAVLVCGALFALYHQSPAQTIYQFLCGACFALVAFRSGSVLPTVLSHFVNNALIIVLYALGVSSFSIAAVCVFAVLLVLSLSYLFFFDKKLSSESAEKSGRQSCEKEDSDALRGVATKEKADGKGFILYALGGAIVCAINWISVLLA